MQIEKIFIEIENPGHGLFWLLWCLLPWWFPAVLNEMGLQICKRTDTNFSLWGWGLQVVLAGIVKGCKRHLPLYSRTMIGVNHTCLCIEAGSDLEQRQISPKKNDARQYTTEKAYGVEDEIEIQDLRIQAWARGF